MERQNIKPGFFQRFLVMDCESSGMTRNNIDPSYDPETGKVYQAVSWGFVVVDSQTMKKIDTLYVELKWDGQSTWDSAAEKVHGLSKSYLDKNGLSTEEAAEVIYNFIDRYFGPLSINVLTPCAGHNVSTFDIYFLRRLFSKFGINFLTGNRFIDTSTLGFVCYNEFNSDDLFNILNIQRTTHNALEDALCSYKVIKNTRIIFDRVLNQ